MGQKETGRVELIKGIYEGIYEGGLWADENANAVAHPLLNHINKKWNSRSEGYCVKKHEPCQARERGDERCRIVNPSWHAHRRRDSSPA